MRLLQLKITLLDVQPPVWRRVLVSPHITLGQMHSILQVVMGWQNAHLHRFRAGSQRWSDPAFGLDDRSDDERASRIGEILGSLGSRLLYDYDFGDNWVHAIDSEEVTASDEVVDFAVCTAGSCACPPEDCGGPPGYGDILRMLKDSRNRKYKQMRAWVGSHFDPEAFSVSQVNGRLERLYPHTPATGKRS